MTAATVLILALSLAWTPVRLVAVPTTQRNARTVLVGVMEVVVEDADRASRILYFLVSGDRRISLRFERRPVNLLTGTQVRVRGRWEKGGTFLVVVLERV